MKVRGLFPEPFDAQDIERALADDDFYSCAFFFMGFEETWLRALDQTSRLLTQFESEDREWRPIYRLLSLLIARAETFDETGALLDKIVASVGMLPGSSLIEEIKMANLHKIDPQAWQREKNRRWVDSYAEQLRQLGAMKAEPTDAA
jgi:hypothetical protein